MKRGLIILLLLFSASFVSALSIDMKQSYKPGETALITIEGNFIDALKPEQISFKSGRINIPLIYDLGKIQDKYYIWALLPDQEKNLTLLIQEAHYAEASKEYKQDITKNFSVIGNLTSFSISPGFIISEDDFEIKVQSKAKAITVKTEFLGETQEVYIPESQLKRIKFSIADVSGFTVTELKISDTEEVKTSSFFGVKTTTSHFSYTIPVAIITKKAKDKETNDTDENNVTISKKFRFSPTSKDLALILNKEREVTLDLINIGNEKLEDIKFILSPEIEDIVEIQPETLDLDEDQIKQITLKIKSNRAGIISGKIEAKADNASTTLDLKLSIEAEKTTNQTGKTCVELGGKQCKKDQKCKGETNSSLEGSCCVGDCEQKTSSPWKYVWLLIIILVLLGIAYFLVRRYKKPGQSPSSLLKDKQKRAEERFKQVQSEEVRGKLGRE